MSESENQKTRTVKTSSELLANSRKGRKIPKAILKPETQACNSSNPPVEKKRHNSHELLTILEETIAARFSGQQNENFLSFLDDESLTCMRDAVRVSMLRDYIDNNQSSIPE
jgi:hypothetical protein